MKKTLKEKVIVITGASSGIGEAMARVYAAQGARVVLGARSVQKLQLITGEIRAQGGQAVYCGVDVTVPDQCRELIARQIDLMRRETLSARRLSMAKKQFLAQMAISMENNESYMLGAGKSLLMHDDIDTLEEVYRKVAAVTAQQITDVANEIFSTTSMLMYK